MKSTVEHLNPTRVKLTVEIGFDELKPHFDKAYKTLAGQVKIPGFRPGRVPAKILDARLGRGAVLTQVVNDAVPAKYGEAVTAENLQVLSQPEIEINRIEDGKLVEFTAEMDVRPEFTLPATSEITVTVDDIEVTDAEVDEQVQALRERFATTTALDRPAQDGDLVTLDLRAAIGDEDLPDATADGLSYRVGSGELVAGIDDAVTGLSAGESATFESALVAGDHAGEDAQITVTVTAVSERTLPEVDADFAQLASEFDTVEEMRANLAEKIRRIKNLQQGAQARDEVLKAMLDATDIAVPEQALKAEIEARQHEAIHTFDHDEQALAAHLDSIGQTREELDKDIDESASHAVQSQLLLDAMAEAAGVTVSQEEFTQQVIYNAQRFRMSPDQYFGRLQEAGQLGGVFAEVRRNKAMMTAVQQATIKDASGNTLDFATLFGLEVVEDDDQAGEDGSSLSATSGEGVEATGDGDEALGGEAALTAPVEGESARD